MNRDVLGLSFNNQNSLMMNMNNNEINQIGSNFGQEMYSNGVGEDQYGDVLGYDDVNIENGSPLSNDPLSQLPDQENDLEDLGLGGIVNQQ